MGRIVYVCGRVSCTSMGRIVYIYGRVDYCVKNIIDIVHNTGILWANNL